MPMSAAFFYPFENAMESADSAVYGECPVCLSLFPMSRENIQAGAAPFSFPLVSFPFAFFFLAKQDRNLSDAFC